jgi:NADPH-dependent glutamate synthase beta subunit-like oxidoreductase
MPVNKIAPQRLGEPYFCDKTAPCNQACPAGENIVEYIYLATQGQFREAWELVREENPFPGVCGRICPHPCESECNRREMGGAIAIHALERFLADYGRTLPRPRPKSRPQRSKQVAIVGSGPAGLSCAYNLARMGYGATVFEALPKAGGMMRAGVPRFRLPRAVLDQEIADIKALGVEIRTNILIGRDITLDQLRGFDALFIATGFGRSSKLDVPGAEARGVFSGLELLKRVNFGDKVRIREKVAIIGGGNTALYAARSLLRLGCRPTVVYDGSQQHMPAVAEEVERTLEEGIEIIDLAAPGEILVQGGRVKGVEFARVRLGKPDKSGHRRPAPVKGSHFRLKVDGVVSATQELPDLSFLPHGIKTELLGIAVDRGCFTSREGVFAGGDVATGVGTIADAIGSGKRAALAIDRYLKGEDFFSIADQPGTAHILPKDVDPSVVRFEDLNPAYFEERAQVPQRFRPGDTRIKGFQEVCLGYREGEAVAEAGRCFSCGVCNMCENCLIFCPDIAIFSHHRKFGYKIDYQRCTGCGICVQECPRNAISMRKVRS